MAETPAINNSNQDRDKKPVATPVGAPQLPGEAIRDNPGQRASVQVSRRAAPFRIAALKAKEQDILLRQFLANQQSQEDGIGAVVAVSENAEVEEILRKYGDAVPPELRRKLLASGAAALSDPLNKYYLDALRSGDKNARMAGECLLLAREYVTAESNTDRSSLVALARAVAEKRYPTQTQVGVEIGVAAQRVQLQLSPQVSSEWLLSRERLDRNLRDACQQSDDLGLRACACMEQIAEGLDPMLALYSACEGLDEAQFNRFRSFLDKYCLDQNCDGSFARLLEHLSKQESWKGYDFEAVRQSYHTGQFDPVKMLGGFEQLCRTWSEERSAEFVRSGKSQTTDLRYQAAFEQYEIFFLQNPALREQGSEILLRAENASTGRGLDLQVAIQYLADNHSKMTASDLAFQLDTIRTALDSDLQTTRETRAALVDRILTAAITDIASEKHNGFHEQHLLILKKLAEMDPQMVGDWLKAHGLTESENKGSQTIIDELLAGRQPTLAHWFDAFKLKAEGCSAAIGQLQAIPSAEAAADPEVAASLKTFQSWVDSINEHAKAAFSANPGVSDYLASEISVVRDQARAAQVVSYGYGLNRAASAFYRTFESVDRLNLAAKYLQEQSEFLKQFPEVRVAYERAAQRGREEGTNLAQTADTGVTTMHRNLVKGNTFYWEDESANAFQAWSAQGQGANAELCVLINRRWTYDHLDENTDLITTWRRVKEDSKTLGLVLDALGRSRVFRFGRQDFFRTPEGQIAARAVTGQPGEHLDARRAIELARSGVTAEQNQIAARLDTILADGNVIGFIELVEQYGLPAIQEAYFKVSGRDLLKDKELFSKFDPTLKSFLLDLFEKGVSVDGKPQQIRNRQDLKQAMEQMILMQATSIEVATRSAPMPGNNELILSFAAFNDLHMKLYGPEAARALAQTVVQNAKNMSLDRESFQTVREQLAPITLALNYMDTNPDASLDAIRGMLKDGVQVTSKEQLHQILLKERDRLITIATDLSTRHDAQVQLAVNFRCGLLTRQGRFQEAEALVEAILKENGVDCIETKDKTPTATSTPAATQANAAQEQGPDGGIYLSEQAIQNLLQLKASLSTMGGGEQQLKDSTSEVLRLMDERIDSCQHAFLAQSSLILGSDRQAYALLKSVDEFNSNASLLDLGVDAWSGVNRNKLDRAAAELKLTESQKAQFEVLLYEYLQRLNLRKQYAEVLAQMENLRATNRFDEAAALQERANQILSDFAKVLEGKAQVVNRDYLRDTAVLDQKLNDAISKLAAVENGLRTARTICIMTIATGGAFLAYAGCAGLGFLAAAGIAIVVGTVAGTAVSATCHSLEQDILVRQYGKDTEKARQDFYKAVLADSKDCAIASASCVPCFGVLRIMGVGRTVAGVAVRTGAVRTVSGYLIGGGASGATMNVLNVTYEEISIGYNKDFDPLTGARRKYGSRSLFARKSDGSLDVDFLHGRVFSGDIELIKLRGRDLAADTAMGAASAFTGAKFEVFGRGRGIWAKLALNGGEIAGQTALALAGTAAKGELYDAEGNFNWAAFYQNLGQNVVTSIQGHAMASGARGPGGGAVTVAGFDGTGPGLNPLPGGRIERVTIDAANPQALARDVGNASVGGGGTRPSSNPHEGAASSGAGSNSGTVPQAQHTDASSSSSAANEGASANSSVTDAAVNQNGSQVSDAGAQTSAGATDAQVGASPDINSLTDNSVASAPTDQANTVAQSPAGEGSAQTSDTNNSARASTSENKSGTSSDTNSQSTGSGDSDNGGSKKADSGEVRASDDDPSKSNAPDQEGGKLRSDIQPVRLEDAKSALSTETRLVRALQRAAERGLSAVRQLVAENVVVTKEKIRRAKAAGADTATVADLERQLQAQEALDGVLKKNEKRIKRAEKTKAELDANPEMTERRRQLEKEKADANALRKMKSGGDPAVQAAIDAAAQRYKELKVLIKQVRTVAEPKVRGLFGFGLMTDAEMNVGQKIAGFVWGQRREHPVRFSWPLRYITEHLMWAPGMLSPKDRSTLRSLNVELHKAWKEAKATLRQQLQVDKAARGGPIRTLLAPDPGPKTIEAAQKLVDYISTLRKKYGILHGFLRSADEAGQVRRLKDNIPVSRVQDGRAKRDTSRVGRIERSREIEPLQQARKDVVALETEVASLGKGKSEGNKKLYEQKQAELGAAKNRVAMLETADGHARKFGRRTVLGQDAAIALATFEHEHPGVWGVFNPDELPTVRPSPDVPSLREQHERLKLDLERAQREDAIAKQKWIPERKVAEVKLAELDQQLALAEGEVGAEGVERVLERFDSDAQSRDGLTPAESRLLEIYNQMQRAEASVDFQRQVDALARGPRGVFPADDQATAFATQIVTIERELQFTRVNEQQRQALLNAQKAAKDGLAQVHAKYRLQWRAENIAQQIISNLGAFPVDRWASTPAALEPSRSAAPPVAAPNASANGTKPQSPKPESPSAPVQKAKTQVTPTDDARNVPVVELAQKASATPASEDRATPATPIDADDSQKVGTVAVQDVPDSTAKVDRKSRMFGEDNGAPEAAKDSSELPTSPDTSRKQTPIVGVDDPSLLTPRPAGDSSPRPRFSWEPVIDYFPGPLNSSRNGAKPEPVARNVSDGTNGNGTSGGLDRSTNRSYRMGLTDSSTNGDSPRPQTGRRAPIVGVDDPSLLSPRPRNGDMTPRPTSREPVMDYSPGKPNSLRNTDRQAQVDPVIIENKPAPDRSQRMDRMGLRDSTTGSAAPVSSQSDSNPSARKSDSDSAPTRTQSATNEPRREASNGVQKPDETRTEAVRDLATDDRATTSQVSDAKPAVVVDEQIARLKKAVETGIDPATGKPLSESARNFVADTLKEKLIAKGDSPETADLRVEAIVLEYALTTGKNPKTGKPLSDSAKRLIREELARKQAKLAEVDKAKADVRAAQEKADQQSPQAKSRKKGFGDSSTGKPQTVSADNDSRVADGDSGSASARSRKAEQLKRDLDAIEAQIRSGRDENGAALSSDDIRILRYEAHELSQQITGSDQPTLSGREAQVAQFDSEIAMMQQQLRSGKDPISGRRLEPSELRQLEYSIHELSEQKAKLQSGEASDFEFHDEIRRDNGSDSYMDGLAGDEPDVSYDPNKSFMDNQFDDVNRAHEDPESTPFFDGDGEDDTGPSSWSSGDKGGVALAEAPTKVKPKPKTEEPSPEVDDLDAETAIAAAQKSQTEVENKPVEVVPEVEAKPETKVVEPEIKTQPVKVEEKVEVKPNEERVDTSTTEVAPLPKVAPKPQEQQQTAPAKVTPKEEPPVTVTPKESNPPSPKKPTVVPSPHLVPRHRPAPQHDPIVAPLVTPVRRPQSAEPIVHAANRMPLAPAHEVTPDATVQPILNPARQIHPNPTPQKSPLPQPQENPYAQHMRQRQDQEQAQAQKRGSKKASPDIYDWPPYADDDREQKLRKFDDEFIPIADWEATEYKKNPVARSKRWKMIHDQLLRRAAIGDEERVSQMIAMGYLSRYIDEILFKEWL